MQVFQRQGERVSWSSRSTERLGRSTVKKEGSNRLSAAISHRIVKLPESRTTLSMSISGSENPTIRSLFIKHPPPVTAPKILRYRRAHELSKQPSCHL